jgi:ABC-2 type transport system permease protein
MMRMLAVAWKEFAQLRRDRLTLGIMLAIPAMQFLLFGYAINTDVRHLPLVVLDQDRTQQSRELVRALEATTYFVAAGEVATYDDIARALRTGAARAALVVRREFSADLSAGRPARAQLVIDGTDPLTVTSASNAAVGLATQRAVGLLVSRLAATGAPAAVPLSLEATIWYNPELRTAVYVVPGLVGVILTLTMVMLTAMGIARERERGTIEALVVSPVRRLELVTGKILPYIGIGYVQMTLVLLLGHVLFGITLEGGLAPLYAVALLFIAANLAIGLFFSTVAQTQGQAMQMSFFFLLPNILLSGFMFPFEGMPRVIAPIGELLPLTHFLRIVRGLELKGASLAEMSHEILWLAVAVIVLVTLSAARFKKRLA